MVLARPGRVKQINAGPVDHVIPPINGREVNQPPDRVSALCSKISYEINLILHSPSMIYTSFHPFLHVDATNDIIMSNDV